MLAEACSIVRGSDDLDGDTIGVCCERLEVGLVAGDHRPAGFGERYVEDEHPLAHAIERPVADASCDDVGVAALALVRLAHLGAHSGLLSPLVIDTG